MTAPKCVVEGCDLEYDVVCSFSFYNVNISSDSEQLRQEWIEGAMQEESECLWRHVSLQLCGYHFELDAQGLWIDSPMLPELLTLPEQVVVLSENDRRVADVIRMEHNYCADVKPAEPEEPVSRLNVRTLVDTLGYLSLKNLQRKQLWVARVETERAEASVTQAEQVIAKLQQPKNIIEIIPQNEKAASEAQEQTEGEVLHIIDPSNISDNFIYEIAEEQEISMEEVKEIPVVDEREWMVNIIPEETKPKYAYIKHCTTGKKKRHFTSEMNEITLEGDFDNYYILPDADPSVGVEITTSYEPENYIIQEYDHLLLEERPRKRGKETKEFGKRKKKREQVKIKQEEEWMINNSSIVYEEPAKEYEEKKVSPRVRRKNKKYLTYEERASL